MLIFFFHPHTHAQTHTHHIVFFLNQFKIINNTPPPTYTNKKHTWSHHGFYAHTDFHKDYWQQSRLQFNKSNSGVRNDLHHSFLFLLDHFYIALQPQGNKARWPPNNSLALSHKDCQNTNARKQCKKRKWKEYFVIRQNTSSVKISPLQKWFIKIIHQNIGTSIEKRE